VKLGRPEDQPNGHRLRAAKKPATTNRGVTALKAVLNRAVSEGWLSVNPLVRLAKLSEDEYVRIRYLIPDERKRFLAALDEREAAIRAWRPSTSNPEICRRCETAEYRPAVGCSA